MSPKHAQLYGKIFLQTLLFGWIGLGVVLAQDGMATPTAVMSEPITATSTLVSVSPTLTATDVATAAATPTATSTHTPTATYLPLESHTPTVTTITVPATSTPAPPVPLSTAAVITRLVPIVVTAPPVIVTQVVAIPAATQPPRSNLPVAGTLRPSDVYGWTRAESIALIQVTGNWNLRQYNHASAGAYHDTPDNGADLRLPFEGDGIRVGFIAQEQGGVFRLLVDGAVIATVDTSNWQTLPLQTEAYFTTAGYHVLDIVAVLPVEQSRSIHIDYVDVFNGPLQFATATRIPSTSVPERIVLEDVELVSRPFTPTASPTVLTESPLALDVIVGYDHNANGQIEPNEGVSELSIRVVDARDNRLLASVLTDAAGFARIQTVVAGDVVILVPLLGEALLVRPGSRQSSWVLRLDAVNVPGLIP